MGTVYTLPYFPNTPTADTLKSSGLVLQTSNGEPYSVIGCSISGTKCALFDNGDSAVGLVCSNINAGYYLYWIHHDSSGVLSVKSRSATNLSNYGLDYGILSNSFTQLSSWAELVIDIFTSQGLAIEALVASGVTYPITYHYTNSTVSGPSEAAIGDTVTVSAVPNAGYGITDASSQILVTNNDVAVPYTWDAANNRITFTMPDPS